MTNEEILNLPMSPNDADAKTIKDYLMKLAAKVWQEDECFSGKRPFGNSGWKHDVYGAMVKGGAIKGEIAIDEGFEEITYDEKEERKADALISAAIASL